VLYIHLRIFSPPQGNFVLIRFTQRQARHLADGLPPPSQRTALLLL
jgi:hypothetical protein